MDKATSGQRTLRRMLVSALSIALLVYVGLGALLFLFQTRLIFIGGGSMWRDPSAFGWKYDEVMLDVEGEKTCAWFLHADAPKGVIIVSHGNGGAIADWLEFAIDLRPLGYDILLYDYGGYGRSTGRSSERRAYGDIRAVWRYLTEERGIAPSTIALYGRSLGGGPTCQLATETPPGAVILDSAFTSIPDMAQPLIPIYPMRLLWRNRMDNAAKIARIASPMLILHSPTDEVVPYANGERLYALASEPKVFLALKGGHNDPVFLRGEDYLPTLERFLAEHLTAAPAKR